MSGRRHWPSDAHGRRFTAVALVVLGAILVASLVACGGATGAVDTGPGSGQQLYAQSCASCHGTDLGGTDLGPPLLSIVYAPAHHPDEAFRSAIVNGVAAHHWEFGPMPPLTGLGDADIDAIIAFVREVQQREGFEPYPPG
jgi:mono/diheme cytochrome c family protein